MNNAMYPIAAIAVGTAVTFALRALPFALFGNRPLPKIMQYLGHVLPPAIMTILVIFCMRSIDFTAYPFGMAEILPCIAVAALQFWKKNMYLSIMAGTVLYMILIRLN